MDDSHTTFFFFFVQLSFCPHQLAANFYLSFGSSSNFFSDKVTLNLNASVGSANISRKNHPKHLPPHVFYPVFITVIPFSMALKAVVQPFQTVENSPARLIFRSTRRDPAHLSFGNFTGFWLTCTSDTKHAISVSK